VSGEKERGKPDGFSFIHALVNASAAVGRSRGVQGVAREGRRGSERGSEEAARQEGKGRQKQAAANRRTPPRGCNLTSGREKIVKWNHGARDVKSALAGLLDEKRKDCRACSKEPISCPL